MSKLDSLTDTDLEYMLPNARAMEYAERFAQQVITGQGKVPVRFARELIRLIGVAETRPTLWQRIKRFLELGPPENKNKFSLDIKPIP